MKFVYLADNPEALPLVAKWYYDEWGRQHGVDSIDKSKEILMDYQNRNRLPLMLLAKEKNEILGAVQLKYYEMDIYPNKEHWLGGVYVSETHRKRKIARKLVMHAVEIAKSHEVNVLYLQTEKLDGGLYTILGWKPIEKVTYRNKNVFCIFSNFIFVTLSPNKITS